MKIGVIGAGRLGICFALLCEQAGYDVEKVLKFVGSKSPQFFLNPPESDNE